VTCMSTSSIFASINGLSWWVSLKPGAKNIHTGNKTGETTGATVSRASANVRIVPAMCLRELTLCKIRGGRGGGGLGMQS